MGPDSCPHCGRATVVSGLIISGQENIGVGFFLPNETKQAYTWPGLSLRGGVRACATCGHVWASLDPGELREFITTHGKELARQQLDEFDHGPTFGMPDTSLTREIAAKVAEIDILVRENRPGAAGRYRELQGAIWDEAIRVTQKWRELTRDEKLALFGWVAKKEPPDDLL